MKNMTIKARLMLAATLAALALLCIGGLGLWGIAQSNAALQTVYVDRTIPATQLGQIEKLLMRQRVRLSEAALRLTEDAINKNTEVVESAAAEIDKLWAAYAASEMTAEESALAAEMDKQRAIWMKDGIRPAVDKLRGGDVDAAQGLIIEALPPMFRATEKTVQALIKLQLDVAQQEFAAAEMRYARIRTTMLITLAIAMVAAVVACLRLAASLMAAIGAEPEAVRAVADAVAAGNLLVDVRLRKGDAGSVMVSMQRMRDQLQSTVGQVRSDANSVASASEQIAVASHDLAVRTQQQAAALEETAAAMEQLGGTVRLNAESAATAHDLARQAHEVAERGGAAVAQVVETMHGISESSRRIAEINSVIDGIAFQTNILALNAAVEAARAGEQGRGFAVVASEVRTLAQRSAQAAKEIKGLIDDSVQRVDTGVEQVRKAGETTTEIGSVISRVSTLMGEINSATAEQSRGVEQVGLAVSQMDQATQQNAAMVEECEAAAQSLRAQADQLITAVSVFKLEEAAVTVPAKAAAPAPAIVERRGPDRARNVVRPAFGAQAPLATKAVVPAAQATGTDDWASF